MKRSVWAVAACGALGALTGGGASAQQAGDWVIGAGWMRFVPQEESQPLRLTAPVMRPMPGSGARLSNANTLGLTATYYFTQNWGVETVLGIPPRFKLYGTGTLAGVGEVGEARQWSPAVLARYHFGTSESTWRPFVGLGATYVRYSDIELTQGVQNYLGNALRRPALSTATTAELKNSFAPVINAGITYQINRNWGLSFSVSYIRLKTEATLTTRTLTGLPVATSKTELKLNPIVTLLSATYTF